MAAYLYDHPNPNAPVRDNGIRFFGYPTRRAPVRFIGVHTAENLPDLAPPDLGAESVARYFATTDRPASAHENVDTDSHVTCLPDDATAFAARGYNSPGWHLEICTQAHRWATLPPSWRDQILERAAARCAIRAAKYSIPPVLLTRSQVDAGARGFVGHDRLDPSRRTDPGAAFPWTDFLGRVRARLTPETAMLKILILAHPSDGVPDAIGALYAASLLVSGIDVTFDANRVRHELKQGVRCVAIGRAAELVAGDEDLAGVGRVDTAEDILAFVKAA